MENSQVTNLTVIIRNDRLEKCRDLNDLNNYVKDVIVPTIFESITTVPKGAGGEIRIGCDHGGCTIGGSIKF